MLEQFVNQLKRNHPSIQEVRIAGKAFALTSAAQTETTTTDETSEPTAEAFDTSAAAGDTSASPEATEGEASQTTDSSSEGDVAAVAAEAAKASEPEEAAPATSDEVPASLELVVLIRKYHLKTVNSILNEIAAWGEANGSDIKPVVLTPRETELLQRYSVNDTELQPDQIIESYKQKEGYPATARRHVLAALEEIQRLLRNLEQDFPTAGHHAWSNAQIIASLLERLTRWGAALYGQEYTNAKDMWSFLLKQFSTHRYLSKPEVVYFPFRLEAFQKRHQVLAPLVTQTYGNNDLEVEQLTQPLLSLARELRRQTHRRLTLDEERKQRTRRRLLVSSVSVGTLAIAAVVLWWFLRPPVISAVSLPKGSITGGIVGNYYGGQNFNRFITRRVDRGINMYWHNSPLKKVPADFYSVRWKGYLEAPHGGKYRLCAEYDDGAQFRVGTKDVVKDWRVGGARTKCKVLFLEKGWHPLHLQMFEARGMSVIKLSWEHPKRKGVHPIPSKHFCCKK